MHEMGAILPGFYEIGISIKQFKLCIFIEIRILAELLSRSLVFLFENLCTCTREKVIKKSIYNGSKISSVLIQLVEFATVFLFQNNQTILKG